MYKEVEKACQKVCKQGKDDIKVKVVYEAPSYIFFTLYIAVV